jgi:hypothetical protein
VFLGVRQFCREPSSANCRWSGRAEGKLLEITAMFHGD